MVKHIQRLAAECAALGLFLCGVWLLLPFSVSAELHPDAIAAEILEAQSGGDVQKWIDNTLIPAPAQGTNDWYALALAASGQYDLRGYAEALADAVTEKFPSGTAGERMALTMLACADIAPDICETILNECIGKQGIMSWIFGLHLLNNGVSADVSIETAVNELLSRQCADGGWAVMGEYGDVDVTAMTLQALAPYQHASSVENAVNRAISFLSERQLNSGAYSSFGVENPESTAQVWIALRALNIDISDARFVKSGTLLDGIMQFLLGNGQFSHIIGGEANETASEQVFLALTADSLPHSLYLFHGAIPTAEISAITSITTDVPKTESTAITSISSTSAVSVVTTSAEIAETSDTDYNAENTYITSETRTPHTEISQTEPTITVKMNESSDHTDSETIKFSTYSTSTSAINTTQIHTKYTSNIQISGAEPQNPATNYPYRIPVTIGAGAVLIAGSVFLWVRKKRSVKSYLTLAFFCGTAVILAWVLKIETPEQYYQQPDKAGSAGSVTMSIRCDVIVGMPGSEKYPSDGVILPETEFPLDTDDSALDVLYDAVKTFGLQIEVDGVSGDIVDNAYVRGISSLYEFDFGELSGWTYTVNGTRPAVGAGACPLHDGDVVVWAYTVNL